ncbi:MAG: 5'/3'-nucleotidase SurE [Alphaproteobacteria bacterium]|nr:5'/3'-nucleotidase SurE [Alphaproteobacteria bacterium]
MAKKSSAHRSKLRILVCNDDGVQAPGIKTLERIARTLSDDVWVVAPETEQSAASHSLTLRDPLRIRAISKRRYAVDGTPTDAVVLAVQNIVKDRRPDLLLSGINRGANLAEDVTYSGTVAAAIEGTILGIPSIALSQVFRYPHPVKWSTAEHFAARLILDALAAGWPGGVLLNVNFPDVPAVQVGGVEVTRQGRRGTSDLVIDERVDARNVPYYWIGYRRHRGPSPEGTDLAAIAAGRISVSPLSLDLSNEAASRRLRGSFKG